MAGSSTRVLEIVEAIYRDETSERAWLDGILVATRPALDQGLGVAAYPIELAGLEIRTPWARVLGAARDVGPALIKALMATTREDAQVSRSVRAAPPCATASELGLADRRGFDVLKRKGILDLSGVIGLDTTGHGVFLGGFLPKVTRLDPAFRARFERVGAHLGVGLRYRRLAKRARRAPEAVLTPGAKLLHAEGEATTATARDRLVRAVKAIDRARGRQGRADPDGALLAWKGLVGARWSLVDEFESDGKRYVVARENEPHAMPLGALSKRERQIVGYVVLGHTTKLIAYELGIADSTVRVLLRRAMQRLGVTTRIALVARFMAACAREPVDGSRHG